MLIRAVLPYGFGGRWPGRQQQTQTRHQQRRHLQEPAGCHPRGAGRPQTRRLRDLARRAGPGRAVAPVPRRPCGSRRPRARVGWPRRPRVPAGGHLSRSLARFVSEDAGGPTLGTSARAGGAPGVVESTGSIQTQSSPEHERQDPNAILTDSLPLSSLFRREAVRAESLLFPPDGTVENIDWVLARRGQSLPSAHRPCAPSLDGARVLEAEWPQNSYLDGGATDAPARQMPLSHPSH